MSSHPTDDQLELYALRRLPPTERDSLEDHLVICASCRDRCEEVTDFTSAMREAFKTAPAEVESRWFAWLRPKLALAGAFAALVVAIALYWTTGSHRLTAVAALQLTAMRGSDVASVEPARELDITLGDAAGAARVEILRTDGTSIWAAPYASLTIVRKELPEGDYLLRAYLPSGQMLHEYSFRIEKGK